MRPWTPSSRNPESPAIRRPYRALIALAALGLLAAGSPWVLLRASLAQVDGERPVKGLEAAVTVTWDERGVPTLRGRTRADVARATGFVHAQERFFQMDLLRRLAAGELSALFGAVALDADRKVRLHGLRHVAREVLGAAPARHRALLDAYAEGVNAGMAALAAAPPEYLLLGAGPQPWRPEDSLLVVLAMFLRLSDAEALADARHGRLHECLPPAAARFLASDDASWAAPLDGGPLAAAAIPSAADYDLRRLETADFDVGRSVADTLDADTELPRGASNAWAVSGALTDDGRALVASDMHLQLAHPNTWYRMRLVVEDPAQPLDLTGVTLPGGPVVVAGSNGRVAWGFTNAYGDWSDRVTLAIDPSDAGRYRTPSGWRRLDYREERIEVAGEATVTLRVPVSVFGPVVEDWRGRPVALRWTGHHPEAVSLDILAAEGAASVPQLLEAGARFGIPPQNLVAGDADGRVGWTVAGRIPLRRPGYDPTRPHSSAAGDAGWDGWLPPAQHPRVLDPADGLVWTANNHVVTGDALRLLGDGGYWHGARARQIRDRLRTLARADEQAMLELMLDDRALLLVRWHRLLTRVAATGRAAAHAEGAAFRAALAGWRGRAASDAVAYRLVHAFRLRLRDVVFAALTAPCRGIDPDYRFEGFRQQEGPLWRLLQARPAHLLHPAYPDWDALLDAVAVEIIEHFAAFDGPIRERTWGEHNHAHLRHPLSQAVPGLGMLLDTGPDPAPGDRHVPRVHAFGAAASERFAVRPGRETAGIFHMPGGQSGHFLSPWYRAGHEDWLLGRPTAFLPEPEAHRLVLVPAPP
jgi:penicillin amidase